MSLCVGSIAQTPEVPYYILVLTFLHSNHDQGYGEMADRLVKLAAQMPGFLGVESARGYNGFGITVSYWKSGDAINQWKIPAQHQIAQSAGKKMWYTDYMVRVAKVERACGKTAELVRAAPNQR